MSICRTLTHEILVLHAVLRQGGHGMQVLLSILCFLRLPVGLSICGGVKVCRERVHCTCGYWTLCWHALSGVVWWHFWVVVVVVTLSLHALSGVL